MLHALRHLLTHALIIPRQRGARAADQQDEEQRQKADSRIDQPSEAFFAGGFGGRQAAFDGSDGGGNGPLVRTGVQFAPCGRARNGWQCDSGRESGLLGLDEGRSCIFEALYIARWGDGARYGERFGRHGEAHHIFVDEGGARAAWLGRRNFWRGGRRR